MRVLRLRKILVLVLLAGGARLCAQTPDPESKFRLAAALEQSGDYDHALQLYKELYVRDPSNPAFSESVQRVLLQTKRYDEAIAVMTSRLRETPGDISLRSTLGTTLYRAGRENDAYGAWNSIIEQNPKSQIVYRVVASAEIEVRLLDRAVETYQRGRKTMDDENVFSLELAQLFVAKMDYLSASAEYIRFLKLNPLQQVFVQSRMATFTGKPEGRQAAIAAATAELHNNADQYLYELLQWLYVEGHDFDHALETAMKLDKLTSSRGEKLLQFAERALREKEYGIAVKAFEHSLEGQLAAAERSRAMYGYALALKEAATPSDSSLAPWDVNDKRIPEAGASSKAVDAFNGVIAAYPSTDLAARSVYQIGLIRLGRGDLTGTRSAFESARQNHNAPAPFRYTVSLALGNVALRQGDSLRARIEFQQVAAAPDALPDQSDEATFHLAEIDFFGGHIDGATSLLNAMTLNLKADFANDAIALQGFLAENAGSKEALADYAHGEFLARQRRYTEAVAVFQDLVVRFPRALLADDATLRAGELQTAAGFYHESAATYQALLDTFKERSPLLDRAQYMMAVVYDRGIHDAGKALVAYELLLTQYPNSMFVDEARRRIRSLRGEVE